jgi:23S rRNA pseudouridine1911/1915/1917 synthase
MIETVPSALAGERVDRVVALLTGRSRAEAAALVASGAVRIEGRTVTARSARVAEGERLEVEITTVAPPGGLVPDDELGAGLVVVHADDDVAVIDKPPGMVVHPGAGNPTATLVHGLLARFPDIAGVGQPGRPGIVHRLDKDTSGLVMVARSAAAYTGLVDQLRHHRARREYLALVWGVFDAPRGVVDAPIGRSGRTPTRMAVSAQGRSARTGYEVLDPFPDVGVSLVRCSLETGRTHQLRVHLAAIGHPVVGDRRYGGHRQSLVVPRLFLHATHLAFTHPVSGVPLAFDAPLPPDLEPVLEALRGSNLPSQGTPGR